MGRNKFSLVFLVLVSCTIYSKSERAGANPCGTKIPCDDGQCIERDEWCDVFTECTDESDEKYCEKKRGGWFPRDADNKCDITKHFVCDNKQCVPLVLKCDGVQDCEDKSDENNCKNDEPTESNEVTPTPRLLPPSSTSNYYENRMTENGDTPGENIYRQHRQNASLFNSASDTIPAEDFLSPLSPYSTITSVTSDREIPLPHSPYPVPPGRDHAIHPPPSAYPPSPTWDREIPLPLSPYPVPPGRDPAIHPPPSAYPPSPTWDRGIHQLPPTYPPSPTRNPAIDHPHPVYTPSVSVPSSVLQRANRNYPFRHQDPILPRPRATYYSSVQYPTPVTNNIKKGRTAPLPPFHFEQNNSHFWNRYTRNVNNAREWLLGQRDANFGWGKDTPRALVALSLITNSFLSNVTENELMQRRLKVDLGVKLISSSRIREVPLKLSDSELATYINALMATCQDPRSTFDVDLVDSLFKRVNAKILSSSSSVSPFSLITLCLANSSLSNEGLAFLNSTVQANITDEISKDKLILATSALACFAKEYTIYEIRKLLDIAVPKLMQQRRPDGSFGTIYSTALAAQALNAIYSGSWIDSRSDTLRYLSDKQHDNGSFGDMLSTYYTLPALSGRSLVHLRNTQCDSPIAIKSDTYIDDWWNRPGPKKSIVYTLAIENQVPVSLQLTVPVDSNFFDIMQLAQLSNSQFKFLYSEYFQKLDVHTINEIPNDPERGMYWNLYVLDRTDRTVDTRQMYSNDIRELIPQDSQELLYWYLPYKLFPSNPRPSPSLPNNTPPPPEYLNRAQPFQTYYNPPPPVYHNQAPPRPTYNVPSPPAYPNRVPSRPTYNAPSPPGYLI